jgi:hypothetical protein
MADVSKRKRAGMGTKNPGEFAKEERGKKGGVKTIKSPVSPKKVVEFSSIDRANMIPGFQLSAAAIRAEKKKQEILAERIKVGVPAGVKDMLSSLNGVKSLARLAHEASTNGKSEARKQLELLFPLYEFDYSAA